MESHEQLRLEHEQRKFNRSAVAHILCYYVRLQSVSLVMQKLDAEVNYTGYAGCVVNDFSESLS